MFALTVTFRPLNYSQAIITGHIIFYDQLQVVHYLET